jgi:hypothetical protein
MKLSFSRVRAFVSCLLVLGVAGCATTSDSGSPETLSANFEGAAALPAGFRPTETDGNGTPAEWKVETDATSPFGARVLVVHTANLEKTYNICPIDGFSARNSTSPSP